MAVVALHSAATGLSALSTNIDIIANNLANVNTIGFKSFRANFEDLLYEEKKQPGVENSSGDRRPAGLYVGLGTQLSNTSINQEQGSPIESNRDGDMMIRGRGFFQVSLPNQGEGIGYTRAGNFFVNQDGELVLGSGDGPRLEPAITIPTDALRFEVTEDGTVNAFLPGQAEPSNVGQIELASFVNPNGLKAIGSNLYLPTAASGPSTNGTPGDQGFGSILHHYTEASNVDPVRELVDLIKTQRAFEMNSQSIQAADEALQVIGNLRRF